LTFIENEGETERKFKAFMVNEREFDQEKLKNERLERIRIEKVKLERRDLVRKFGKNRINS